MGSPSMVGLTGANAEDWKLIESQNYIKAQNILRCQEPGVIISLGYMLNDLLWLPVIAIDIHGSVIQQKVEYPRNDGCGRLSG